MNSEAEGPLIIFIDDDVDALKVTTSILRIANYNVMCTTDPEVFFEYFKLHDVALAILDVGIPEKSGYELSEEIRTKPGYPDIPILFLSGRGSAGDRLQGFFAGANEYLSKPVAADLLLKTVEKLLKKG
jgi:two-component system sensor histidine kinase ChiS